MKTADPSRTSRIVPVAIALLLALALPGAGCSEGPGSAAGEDHGDPSHDDHDHGDDKDHDDHPDDHDDEKEHADEAVLTAEAVAAAGIRVETATRRVLRPVFTVPSRAALDTDALAHVGVQWSGRVQEVRVRRGDGVTGGQVLLVMECPERGRAQVDFLSALDAMEAAGPPVDLARRLLARAREAHEGSRSLPLSTVEERENALLEAETERAAAKAAATAASNHLLLLGMSGKEIEDLARNRELRTLVEVRSPISGEVLEREVTPGESVGPDRDALMVIGGTEWIWVLAEVPESLVDGVRIGATVTVQRERSGSPPLPGTVRWIEPRIDAGSRTARVRVVLPRKDSGLLPGMFAEVVFPLPGEDPLPVVTVPVEAVQRMAGSAVVFVPVPGEENTFSPRTVRVGPPTGRHVPVLSGLEEGEPFVAAGSFILKAELGKGSAAHEH